MVHNNARSDFRRRHVPRMHGPARPGAPPRAPARLRRAYARTNDSVEDAVEGGLGKPSPLAHVANRGVRHHVTHGSLGPCIRRRAIGRARRTKGELSQAKTKEALSARAYHIWMDTGSGGATQVPRS